jgi:hypothetical protein
MTYGPVAGRAQRSDEAQILLRTVVTDDDIRLQAAADCANGMKSAVRTGKTISSQV